MTLLATPACDVDDTAVDQFESPAPTATHDTEAVAVDEARSETQDTWCHLDSGPAPVRVEAVDASSDGSLTMHLSYSGPRKPEQLRIQVELFDDTGSSEIVEVVSASEDTIELELPQSAVGVVNVGSILVWPAEASTSLSTSATPYVFSYERVDVDEYEVTTGPNRRTFALTSKVASGSDDQGTQLGRGDDVDFEALDLALINFCPQYYAIFADSTASDDYFAQSSSVKLRGARYEVRRNGQVWATGNLQTSGSDAGCTGNLLGGYASWSVRVWTEGTVNGIDILTGRDVTETGGSPETFNVSFGSLADGKVAATSMGVSSAGINAYVVAQWLASRHDFGQGGAGNELRVRTEVSGMPHSGANGIIANITVNDGYLKYVIAHELGHMFAAWGAPDMGVPDIRYSGSTPCQSSGHSIRSIEFQSGALHEGYANFVAVDAFNNHAQSDGVFHAAYATPSVISATGSSTGFPQRYMENACGADAPFNGLGSELDWMRLFWAMHAGGGSKANMAQLLEWFDHEPGVFMWPPSSTAGLGAGFAYERLATSADSIGGVVNSTFDQYAPAHGVDHPCNGSFAIQCFSSLIP